jgi:simple sugar transport system substrate-binding protein
MENPGKVFKWVNYSSIFLIFVLILSAILLLAGCESNKQTSLDEKLRFIFITPCVNEGFFDPVKKGVQDAAQMMDVECSFVGVEDIDNEGQIALTYQAIKDGYDGIALNLIHPTAFNDVVADALDKGVPVVAFNVDSNDPANRRLSCVSQKLYEAGRSLGERAIDSIPANSKILMTMHSEGASALDDRLRGIQDILKRKKITWKVIITGLLPEKAAEIITETLKTGPDIKVVLCTGQADTEGAGLAIERHFADQNFYVAGFDLSPEILRMVMAGTIDFTIDQQPYMQGFYPVIQLALYCRYGITPSNIDAGAGFVTKDNAENVLQLSKAGYR